jgi:hypothetical protein
VKTVYRTFQRYDHSKKGKNREKRGSVRLS